jgi:hypothetical protein
VRTIVSPPIRTSATVPGFAADAGDRAAGHRVSASPMLIAAIVRGH